MEGRKVFTRNHNSDNYSREGNVIREIMANKNISQRELATRMGYAGSSGVHDRLIEKYSMKVSSLVKFCDALGVELCIMDGYEKYRISSESYDEEFDRMLKVLAEHNREEQKRDKYNEKRIEREKAKEKAKEYQKERLKDPVEREKHNAANREYQRKRLREMPVREENNICLKCRSYEPRVRYNGKGYCAQEDRYICKPKCNTFTPKTIK